MPVCLATIGFIVDEVMQHKICYKRAAYELGGRVGMSETHYCARPEELDLYSLLIYTPAPLGQDAKQTPPPFFSFSPKDSH